MAVWTPFILPLGGIMALLPEKIAAQWSGSKSKPGKKSDYELFEDDASDYVTVKKLHGSTVVVFSGDRTPTAWRVDGAGKMTIVRLLCWSDEAVALRFAEKTPTNPSELIDDVVLHAGEYKFLDVARSINQQEHLDLVSVALQPSIYRVGTWLADVDPSNSVIIHRIEFSL